MKNARIVILAAAVLGCAATAALAATQAGAAMPTRLGLAAPRSVEVGEDLTIEARLTTGNGRPVPGATVRLFQVGAVGQRVMAEATTDDNGAVSFLHQEYTLASIVLRVAFAGNTRLAPSQADAEVEVTGIEVSPAVTMSHAPGPLAKGVLFLVLGSVWATYVFAGACVFRIIRDAREAKRGGRSHTEGVGDRP